MKLLLAFNSATGIITIIDIESSGNRFKVTSTVLGIKFYDTIRGEGGTYGILKFCELFINNCWVFFRRKTYWSY